MQSRRNTSRASSAQPEKTKQNNTKDKGKDAERISRDGTPAPASTAAFPTGVTRTRGMTPSVPPPNEASTSTTLKQPSRNTKSSPTKSSTANTAKRAPNPLEGGIPFAQTRHLTTGPSLSLSRIPESLSSDSFGPSPVLDGRATFGEAVFSARPTSIAATPLRSAEVPPIASPKDSRALPVTSDTPVAARAVSALPSASFAISSLSSPTASGNFREDVASVRPSMRRHSSRAASYPSEDDTDGGGERGERGVSPLIPGDEGDEEDRMVGRKEHGEQQDGGKRANPNEAESNTRNKRKKHVLRSRAGRPERANRDIEEEYYNEYHGGLPGGQEPPPARVPGGGAGPGGRSPPIARTTGPMLSTIHTSVSYGRGTGSEGAFDRKSRRGGDGNPAESSRGRATAIGRSGFGGREDENEDRGIRARAGERTARRDEQRDRPRDEDRYSHDGGGVGPHRNERRRRRPSPVGMSARPYPLAEYTPSSGGPSAGPESGANTVGFGKPTTATPRDGEFRFPNSGVSSNGNSTQGEPGPSTQIWERGLGVLRTIEEGHSGADVDARVPSRASASASRLEAGSSPRKGGPVRGGEPSARRTTAGGGGGAPGVEYENSDEEADAVRRVAERARVSRSRQYERRQLEKRNQKSPPRNLYRRGSADSDGFDRIPTESNPALSALAIPQPSTTAVVTSSAAGGKGGVLARKKTAQKKTAGGSQGTGENNDGNPKTTQPENNEATQQQQQHHTRSNTVASASGSHSGALSRLDSAVSQFPPLSGLPESFEGLSGIGGQNELGVSQFEESLPPARFNSRPTRTGPALSTIADNTDADVGASFNPGADLPEPTESQLPSGVHSDIRYNTSGNPISRASGEALRPAGSDFLDPLLRSSRYDVLIPSAQQPTTSDNLIRHDPSQTSQSASQSASQSTSSSKQRKKRFGSYDSADDKVSWVHDPIKLGEDPSRDRTGETTGPRLLTTHEVAALRGPRRVGDDDHEGNLEFGRSRQTVLDDVVRPVRQIRGSSTRAGTDRAGPQARETTGPLLTTGPALGDGPSNPLVIDGNPPSPTWSEMERAGRHYIRTVVRPDRLRRSRSTVGEDGNVIGDGDDGMQGVPLAQPPPYPLTYVSEEDEEEAADDAQPVGNVLVRNSSGSAAGGDEPGGASGPFGGRGLPAGEWYKEQYFEEDLEDDMEAKYQTNQLQGSISVSSTPVGQMIAKTGSKEGLPTQPSMSSVGDLLDGDDASHLSKEYPPNQEEYMRMHRVNSSDVGGSSAGPSQPVQASDTNSTQPSDTSRVEGAGDNPRPANISRYPQPDALSISTENSVMRSQLFSSKLAAYNSDQAGLKPGDEGYSEPPEQNYAKWGRAEGSSDVGSAEPGTGSTNAKGDESVVRPFVNPFFRMPGARMSDATEDSVIEDVPHRDGDSFVIPDSQEESPPLFNQLQTSRQVPASSTVFAVPERPSQPISAGNGTHVSSEAGSSRPRRSSPSKVSGLRSSEANRAVVPSRLAPPANARRSSHTPAMRAPHELAEPPSPRSDAEARIEAELIPETQFSQQTSDVSSLVLGSFSPVIRYERAVAGVAEESQGSADRQPTVLVPGTASTSQVSDRPSVVAASIILATESSRSTINPDAPANVGSMNGNTSSERSGPQGDSFGLNGTGTQDESVNTSLQPVQSFELPDPSGDAAQQNSGTKRKRDEAEVEESQEVIEKPANKRPRKVPVPPTPLPSEPMRATRSLTKRGASLPAGTRLVTPVPPPRPTAVPRGRKRAAAPPPPRTPSPLHARTEALQAIAEVSSPLTPLSSRSPPRRDTTDSPVRRSKTYLKGRTLVADSSTSTVRAAEGPDASADAGTSQTSGTQDPFKSLAKKISKPSPRKGATREAPVPPPQALSEAALPTAPNTSKERPRKRTREPDDDDSPHSDAASPSPSKKRRGEAPESADKPAPRFISTPGRSRQRGGRVFAPRKKYYFTATVIDNWDDGEGGTTCQVKFDDGSYSNMPLASLYMCELREGDHIKVPGSKGGKLGREGNVSAVPLWEEKSRVSVRLATVPREEVAVFEGKNIAVEAEIVRKQWTDRKAETLEDIGLGAELIRAQQEQEKKEAEAKARGRPLVSAALLGPPRWKDSPPPPPRPTSLPSRRQKRPPSAIEGEESATSHKRRCFLPTPASTAPSSKPFSNHLFIHALAVNDDEGNKLEDDQRSARKTELTANIERMGGKVVSGFEALLHWGGSVNDDANSWVWEAGDLQYISDQFTASVKGSKRGNGVASNLDPPKLFLVADSANRNTKYLMALAAGIPCVGQGWINHENALPWTTYLLSAGQSGSLDQASSQLIDYAYSNPPRTLKSLLEEPGPVRKPFKDKSLLFVYPSKAEVDIDEDGFSHTYPYAALACLMGPSRVEVIHDINSASLKLWQYSAIVFEDDVIPSSVRKMLTGKKGGDIVCAGPDWVRECLLLGSFLTVREM